MAKSRMRMPHAEKSAFMEVFSRDFENIMKTLGMQLNEQYRLARVEVMKEEGVVDETPKVKRLERELEELRLELQRLREGMQHTIFTKERELADVKRKGLGDLDGPPDPETLVELGFGHDDKVEDRAWHGIPIRSKLDALSAVKLHRAMDVSAPIRAVERIGEAVKRALLLSASYDDVQAAYDKFYELNFQQYGVDLPPRLDDLRELRGDRLLTMGVTEDMSRLLPAAADRGED